MLATGLGCASIPTASSDAINANGLRSAHIVYNASLVGQANSEDSDVRQVSHTEAPSSKTVEKPAVLVVEYPHPSGNDEKALATLVVLHGDEADTPAAAGWRNRLRNWSNRSLPGMSIDPRVAMARQLSLSKAEVDCLIRESATNESPDKPALPAPSFAMEVNGKNVSSLPPSILLHNLRQRVAASGQVVSAQHPLVRQQLAKLSEANDDFYSTLSDSSDSR